MLNRPAHRPLAPLALLALLACEPQNPKDTGGVDAGGDDCGGDGCGSDDVGGDDLGGDGGVDTGGDDLGGDGGVDTGGDDDGGVTLITGTITGTIRVELSQTSPAGVVSPLAWEDSPFFDAGTGLVNFPYGKIFVAGTADAAGTVSYAGTTVLGTPAPVNTYSLPVAMTAAGELAVYASLDVGQDDIVATDDPTGVWPMLVPVADGDVINNIDITILVDVDMSGGGGTGGGTGGDDNITISGQAIVGAGYGVTEARVMLLHLDGTGPIASTRAPLSPADEGSVGDYSFEVPRYLGQKKLVGAIDSNGNTMIDPADTWGATILTPDVDGNPILVGDTDLVDYPVQIPLAGEVGLSMIPFVRLTGTISGWSIPALTGTSVYVSALKYRPNSEFNIVTTDADFSTESWDWTTDSLDTTPSKNFDLLVPANSVVYLWGYADPNGNQLVNETGEYVSSVGVDGRMEVARSNISGINLVLSEVL